MTQEILIGVERRRRWSDERKLAILAEVGVDGASVSDVARRDVPPFLYPLKRRVPVFYGLGLVG
ncbi:transposase [Gluconacetobacter entanii]|nr:transposase [Gluconacetobacter entanii]